MDELRLPDPRLAAAWRRLVEELDSCGSLLVAFSGGVDSALLLAAARRVLGERVQAALCTGPFTPPWEVERARRLARELGVELVERDLGELEQPQIAANTPERCYHCKRLRLEALLELARERGLAAVAEGSQLDDAGEDRPGSRAVKELGVLSPLARAGLDKAVVRGLSRALGLITAEVPSAACLASRVPYGVPLSAAVLERIARAEDALRRWFSGCLRVRDHFPLARVELEPGDLARASAEPLRSQVVAALKAAGYGQVCLDLEGYRSGGAGRSGDI